jgi:hypothetical protein
MRLCGVAGEPSNPCNFWSFANLLLTLGIGLRTFFVRNLNLIHRLAEYLVLAPVEAV